MSALTLTLKQHPLGRLDLSPLMPALVSGDISGLAALPLQIATQKIPLGELFSVSGSDASQIVLKGDLSRVDGIGAAMQSGSLTVEGNAGAYLGTGLLGGEINVQGEVGHFAGVAMRKGTIHIKGNAGDYLGGILPGAMQGMAGGQIIVLGDVGERCGDRMRRGAILIGGKVGDYAGSRMLAGTIAAFGGAGKHAGYGMRRGTLMIRGEINLDATFADCGQHVLPITNLLFRSWVKLGSPFGDAAGKSSPVHRFMGDRGADGKGEILMFK
jgi:formylmethanofuran dehydrogenase subunit C